jgi:hypothetical protein
MKRSMNRSAVRRAVGLDDYDDSSLTRRSYCVRLWLDAKGNPGANKEIVIQLDEISGVEV